MLLGFSFLGPLIRLEVYLACSNVQCSDCLVVHFTPLKVEK
jgi:hypothetical protein